MIPVPPVLYDIFYPSFSSKPMDTMFADDISTITTSTEQVLYARENIHTYEKASCSELHEGNTKISKH